MPPLFAQIQPAIDHITDGGTRGLLWALCIAVVALTAAVCWLARRLLLAQEVAATTARDVATAHATALSTAQSAYAATILSISERMTSHVAAMTASTEAVLEVVAAMQDTASLLEYTLGIHSKIRPPRRP